MPAVSTAYGRRLAELSARAMRGDREAALDLVQLHPAASCVGDLIRSAQRFTPVTAQGFDALCDAWSGLRSMRQ